MCAPSARRSAEPVGQEAEEVRGGGSEAGRELELLDTAGTDLAELTQRIAALDQDLATRCRALSARRRTAAKRLGVAVTKQLTGLGMPDGVFRVALELREPADRFGAERIEFLVALNPGMGERPMARVASGGELSRLMLALKVELARHDAIPSLVFDEVDQGVGGHVAGRVAEALGRVAADHQVLVITHLPQIAAVAARHLVVAKVSSRGSAETGVAPVEGDARVEEIAKMLGGAEAAPTARRHARELLKAATARA